MKLVVALLFSLLAFNSTAQVRDSLYSDSLDENTIDMQQLSQAAVHLEASVSGFKMVF